ncbi:MAG: hypothetical protein IBX50_11960 [Marinospirillum sp.]|uniref:hypothetical protein n=1 Tax=Marinospirillum sp. TaxID=2183934 RepID=UPI001A0E3D57|nr:hypothetical protein [Marinospirillum sp.]MBE0507413.1 hypothetical protein [Marinospirillum sp.]
MPILDPEKKAPPTPEQVRQIFKMGVPFSKAAPLIHRVTGSAFHMIPPPAECDNCGNKEIHDEDTRICTNLIDRPDGLLNLYAEIAFYCKKCGTTTVDSKMNTVDPNNLDDEDLAQPEVGPMLDFLHFESQVPAWLRLPNGHTYVYSRLLHEKITPELLNGGVAQDLIEKKIIEPGEIIVLPGIVYKQTEREGAMPPPGRLQ